MERVYLGKSKTKMTAVRTKLILLAIEPSETVVDYVGRAKGYNDDLTAMGVPESEKQMMSYIIGGLPKTWAAEKRMLACRRPTDMMDLVESLQDVALKGHKAAECYSNQRSKNFRGTAAVRQSANEGTSGRGQRPRGGFPGNCNHCGKLGHKAIDCYRGGQQQQNKHTPAKINATEAETSDDDVILRGAHKANVARAFGACLLVKCLKGKEWYMDSGCTQHMTNRKEWLQNFIASPIPYVLLGDEGKLPVKGEGDLVLQSVYGEVKLDNVLLVDKLTLNLVSQSQLDSGGCKIFSDKGCLWVFGSDWKVIAEGSRNQGLYEMKLHEKQSGDKVKYLAEPEAGKVAREELRTKLEKVPIKELQQQALPMAAAVSTVDINLLHRRMGHAGHTRLKELVKKNMAAGAKVADGGEENLKCSTCVEAKATKAPHPKHGVREPYETLAIVATDVCGPMRVASRHGSKYFVTFADLGTRHTWVTEIKKKSEVYTSFLDWKAEAERQSGKKLKVLHTDNGAEFVNAEFNTYLKANGIRRQLTVP
ncbi:unnamed protein product, partial [Closterium sp. NIES-53]